MRFSALISDNPNALLMNNLNYVFASELCICSANNLEKRVLVSSLPSTRRQQLSLRKMKGLVQHLPGFKGRARS